MKINEVQTQDRLRKIDKQDIDLGNRSFILDLRITEWKHNDIKQ